MLRHVVMFFQVRNDSVTSREHSYFSLLLTLQKTCNRTDRSIVFTARVVKMLYPVMKLTSLV